MPNDTATQATTYTATKVTEVLNVACDEICEAAELPDSGTRDALNLLINLAVSRLEYPSIDLERCVQESYAGASGEEITLETVLEWIGEA